MPTFPEPQAGADVALGEAQEWIDTWGVPDSLEAVADLIRTKEAAGRARGIREERAAADAVVAKMTAEMQEWIGKAREEGRARGLEERRQRLLDAHDIILSARNSLSAATPVVIVLEIDRGLAAIADAIAKETGHG